MPVIGWSVDVDENSRVVHRDLEPLRKIALNHAPSSVRQSVLQELGEEVTVKDDGMPSPTLVGRCDDRCGFPGEGCKEGQDGSRKEERVIHWAEEDGGRIGGDRSDPRLEGGNGARGGIGVLNDECTAGPGLPADSPFHVPHDYDEGVRPSTPERGESPGQEGAAPCVQEGLAGPHPGGESRGGHNGWQGMRHRLKETAAPGAVQADSGDRPALEGIRPLLATARWTATPEVSR